MAIQANQLTKEVFIKYTANAESILKANADMKAARAAMTDEERKAADVAREAAKEREAAYKTALTQIQGEMKAEQDRARAIEKAEGEAAKAEKEAADARKKQHADWIDGLAKVGLAYDTVSRAFHGAMDLMKDSAEQARIETAAQGIEIDKLKEASGGTRTEMELLTFAARTQHGAMALNTEQMVVVQKAMRELGREGFDLTAINDGITESLTKGASKSLKQFGIDLESTGDKAKDHDAILKALSERAGKLDDSYTSTAEGVQQGSVGMADAMDHLKDAAGNLALQLVPLIKAIGEFGESAAKAAKKFMDDSNEGRAARLMGGGDTMSGLVNRIHSANTNGLLNGNSENDVLAEIMATGADPSQWAGILQKKGISLETVAKIFDYHGAGSGNEVAHNAFAAGGESQAAIQKFADAQMSALSGAVAGIFGARVVEKAHEHTASTAGAGEMDWLFKIQLAIGSKLNELGDAYAAQIAGLHMNMGDAAQFKRWTFPAANSNSTALERWDAAGRGAPGMSAFDDGGQDAAIDEANDQRRRLAPGLKNDKNQKFLESTFGKLSEFNAYKEAFGMLSGAIGAAYKAWVDGSMSSGAAAKAFLKQSLATMGEQMALRSLQELGEGFASLALGPIGSVSASQHFTSAAIFGAGAVAAGVASKAIGGASKSGATAGAGALGAGAVSNSNTSSAPDPSFERPTRPVVIVDDDVRETQRMKQTRFSKKLADAGFGGDS